MAPDNPASTYHPIAITRFGCSDKLITHLLIGGNTSPFNSTSFASSNTALESIATITTPSKTYQFSMIRRSPGNPFDSLIAGFYLLLVTSLDIQYTNQRIGIGYHVTSAAFQGVSFSSSAYFDVQFSAILVNSTYCEFSTKVLKNSANVTCSIQAHGSSGGVVQINGQPTTAFQVSSLFD